MAHSESLPDALNLLFIEELYQDYLRDPAAVPSHWRTYFESLAPGDRPPAGWRLGPSFRRSSLFHADGAARGDDASTTDSAAAVDGVARTLKESDADLAVLQDKVDQLVRAYRMRGHAIAEIDPLGVPRPPQPLLEPISYGLGEADMEREFSADTIPGARSRTLRGILEHLKNTYARSIGVQYTHLDDIAAREWLRERMEATENRVELSHDEQVRILTRLTDAVIFEEFIQKKYLGAKSFSLEGSESLIPLLEVAIERAGEHRIDEIVLAMAHRGRLNVLANIMGKSARDIFREFEDADPEAQVGRGDVKYHLGYSNDWQTTSGHTVHLSLAFNPSHLEFVNPVALGRMRAKQDRVGDSARVRGMVLMIHGDAAFAGEGIVQETLNLSDLHAYTTGGTIHVILNNQIGFTTPPEEGRSSPYATAVAKILQSPIFHVNGEDPEAVVQVVNLAMDYRKRYKRDVFIDMYSYRRRGHNEGDEPSFTQPMMYQAIERRPSVRDGYLEHLLQLGGVTREEADEIAEERRQRLEHALTEARGEAAGIHPTVEVPAGVWRGYFGGPARDADEVTTSVPRERLQSLLESQTSTPGDFHVHPKLKRLLDSRRKMAEGDRPVDWGAAEALAFGSLATDGHRVRLSGQDSARGTFSHRHAVLHDRADGRTYVPLQHLAPDQAPVEVYNSPLSEAGVLGFEYGYSLDCPGGLVLWEAQFGDFTNAAQVIIDQFIAAAEDKWHRLSAIVLLLPHAFEGMGPEHSSARLERFLQLTGEDNIQVVNTTTPAQYFHCLRRQGLREWRKPLVMMTPKSLLRHPKAVSSLDELASGSFQSVIPDSPVTGRESVERVLLCSGKIYFELEAEREKRERTNVAIIRVEELYPFPTGKLKAALEPFGEGTPVFWVQEEPENMGAWQFMHMKYDALLTERPPLRGICRDESGSPATGSASSHRLEQERLIAEAFGDTVS